MHNHFTIYRRCTLCTVPEMIVLFLNQKVSQMNKAIKQGFLLLQVSRRLVVGEHYIRRPHIRSAG